MLTASLVLFKTPHQQITTVLECINNSNCVTKLYIIDNFSNEDNIELLDNMRESLQNKNLEIEYIKHENTGYGSSHNVALRKAIEIGSDYHVILNPDIEFDKIVLSRIVDYMEKRPEVSYLLPKVIYPNGELQYLCRHLPKPIDLFSRRFGTKLSFMKKIDDRYSLKFFSYDKEINPPCLSGCFMFLRMKTIKEYNLLFDDRFFMYFEDFDLIRRIHEVAKTIYYPEVTIVHAHARASHTSKKMFWVFVKSLIKYFNKWGWIFDRDRKNWNNQIDQEIKRVDGK